MRRSPLSSALLLLCLIGLTHATHFRFGNIRYDQLQGGNGRLFRFTIETAWRRTFPEFQAQRPNFVIGDTLREEARFFHDTMLANNNQNGVQFAMVVNTINAPADWFIATQIVDVQYSTDGVFTASFQRCCRISSLRNSRDASFRVTARVPVLAGRTLQSLRSTVIPIVTLQVNQQATLNIGALAFQNENVRYRIASIDEARGIGNVEGQPYTQIPNFGVDFVSGRILWLPSEQGLFTTQVVVEGHRGVPANVNDKATLESTVAVDFIINVISNTQNRCKRFCSNLGSACTEDSQCFNCVENNMPSRNTPYCDPNSPPFFTTLQVNGGTARDVSQQGGTSVDVEAVFDQRFTMIITAQDRDDEDFITIASTALPQNSQFTVTPNSNPARGTFTWTPGQNQPGALICFTATDSLLNTNSGQLCVSIRVNAGNLRAMGDVNFVVAGRPAQVLISNAPNRQHSISITRGGQNPATGTVAVRNVPANDPNPSFGYLGRYNIPNNPASQVTRTGFTVLTVADETAGLANRPAPLLFSLLVANDYIVPAQTLLENGQSTGLNGGLANQLVSFLITPRDQFSNLVFFLDSVPTQQSVPAFRMVLTYRGQTTTFNAVLQARGTNDPYLYRMEYRVPTIVGTDLTYSVQVQMTNTTGSYNAGTFTGSIQATDFTVEVLTSAFTVSNDPHTVRFGIRPRNFGGNGDLQLRVSYNGNQVTATRVNNVQGEYTVNIPGQTLSGTQSRALVITAPALAGGSASFDLTFNPGPPNGPTSVISGIEDVRASPTPVLLTVTLLDRFGNRAAVNNAPEIDYRYKLTDVNNIASPSSTTALVSGKGSLQAATGNYILSVSVPYAGNLLLNATLTVSPAAAQPLGSATGMFNQRIAPGPVSPSRSGFSLARDIVAGTTHTLTITGRDFASNGRIGGDVRDTFFGQFTRLSPRGRVLNNYMGEFVRVADGSAEYVAPFNTTRKGQQTITVFYDDNGSRAEFRAITVNVIAGNAVPKDSNLGGNGTKGGMERTTVSVLMQARDSFGNVLESPRGAVFVAKLTPPVGPVEYFRAHYCAPGALVCEPPARGAGSSYNQHGLHGLQADEEEPVERSTYSADELLLLPDGFWRLSYTVPPRIQGAENFNIEVFYAVESEIQPGDTVQMIIDRNTTQPVSTLVGTADPAPRGGGASAVSSYWPIIAVGIAGGAMLLSSVGYGAWRLQRYRPKYLAEKVRASDAERALREMQDEVDIIPGQQDWEAVGAATVNANPLHEAYQQKRQPAKAVEMVEAPYESLPEKKAFRKEFQPQKPPAQRL